MKNRNEMKQIKLQRVLDSRQKTGKTEQLNLQVKPEVKRMFNAKKSAAQAEDANDFVTFLLRLADGTPSKNDLEMQKRMKQPLSLSFRDGSVTAEKALAA